VTFVVNCTMVNCTKYVISIIRFYFFSFVWVSDFVHCVLHSEKHRPLKFYLTSVRFDHELRNKFASLPGDEKKGNTGFSPRSIRFFPKSQTPRKRACGEEELLNIDVALNNSSRVHFARYFTPREIPDYGIDCMARS